MTFLTVPLRVPHASRPCSHERQVQTHFDVPTSAGTYLNTFHSLGEVGALVPFLSFGGSRDVKLRERVYSRSSTPVLSSDRAVAMLGLLTPTSVPLSSFARDPRSSSEPRLFKSSTEERDIAISVPPSGTYREAPTVCYFDYNEYSTKGQPSSRPRLRVMALYFRSTSRKQEEIYGTDALAALICRACVATTKCSRLGEGARIQYSST